MNDQHSMTFQESLEQFFNAKDPSTAQALPIAQQRKKDKLLEQTASLFNRSVEMHNPDKKQFGVFFSGIEKSGGASGTDQERKSRASNPIFFPSTYTGAEWKTDSYRTSYVNEHGEHQFAGGCPDKKFNLRRTVISEYSNALHNQTIFVNPRFSSC